MSEPKAKTVSVTALTSHTNAGECYEAGDTYDVPEDEVENLVAQGMAKSTADAKQDAADAKQDAKDAKAAEKADAKAHAHDHD